MLYYMKQSTIKRIPNIMTCMRFIMIPSFYYAFTHPNMLLPARGFALAVFMAASLTDLMDGYIARKYNAVSKFGKLADPVADKALVLTALYCLYEAGQLGGWYVLAICIKELLLVGGGLLMLRRGIITQSGLFGKAACALTIAGIGMAIVGWMIGEYMLYAALLANAVAMGSYLADGAGRLHKRGA